MRLLFGRLFVVSFVVSLLIACAPADENVFFGVEPTTEETTENSTASEQSVASVDTSSQPTPTPQSFSNSFIDDFLWKPESERDGNLVVLVNVPNVVVQVTGDRSDVLADFGPSNGRGTTARSDATGCDYGSSVIVEFFDQGGLPVRLADGREFVTIEDGCERTEFVL